VPKEIERKLKLEALKKGLKPKSKSFGSYVYGTLQKVTNWKPGKK
jgi:hypothetical protein